MSDSAPGKQATALILVGFVLVFGTSPVNASSQELAGNSAGGDWLYVAHDLAATMYSSPDTITPNNMSRLAEASPYRFPHKKPSHADPHLSGCTTYPTTTPH